MTFDELKDEMVELLNEYEESHGNLTMVKCIIQDTTDDDSGTCYEWDGEKLSEIFP